ncbi:MAG: hypothetical protein EOO61_12525 [Hymenobacter sp.]|nr:MAG: hypothetical protein EOO61_12525 [Hymenobacter sp.]
MTTFFDYFKPKIIKERRADPKKRDKGGERRSLPLQYTFGILGKKELFGVNRKDVGKKEGYFGRKEKGTKG